MFHRSLGFMWFVGWFDWTCPFCFVDGRGISSLDHGQSFRSLIGYDQFE